MAGVIRRVHSAPNQVRSTETDNYDVIDRSQHQRNVILERRRSLPLLNLNDSQRSSDRVTIRTKRYVRHSLLDTLVPEEESMTHPQLEQILRQSEPIKAKVNVVSSDGPMRRHSDIISPTNMTKVPMSDTGLEKSRRHSTGVSEYSALRSHLSRGLTSALRDTVVCVRCGNAGSCCGSKAAVSRNVARDQFQPNEGSFRRAPKFTEQSSKVAPVTTSDYGSDDDYSGEDEEMDEELLAEMRDAFNENLTPFVGRRLRSMTE